MFGRRFCRSLLCGVLILCAVLCSLSVGFYGHEGVFFENVLYADGKGCFFVLEHDGHRVRLYQSDKNSLVPVAPAETMTVDEVVCQTGQAYLLINCGSLEGIYAPARQLTELVDDLMPQTGCAAITSNGMLYVTDEREPAVIRLYANLYRLQKKVTAPSAVRRLFMTADSSAVYALTDQGIFLPDSNRLVPCDIPAVPFSLNEGVCCDANGTVYMFDAQKGFDRQQQTDYAALCYAQNHLYTYTADTVFQLDENGEPIAFYHPLAQPITAIAASGSHVAVLSEHSFSDCPISDFQPLKTEPVSTVSNEPSVLVSSQPHESVISAVSHADNSRTESRQPSDSRPVQSHEPTETPSDSSIEEPLPSSVTVTTDAYTIDGHLLTDIPLGTTIAVLKRHLSYPHCTLTVRNHHGTIVNSGTVGTGFVLRFSLDEQHYRDYHTVVSGDITGEGHLNTNDLTQLARFLVGSQELTAYQQLAADTNHDGECTVSDLYLLQTAVYGHTVTPA